MENSDDIWFSGLDMISLTSPNVEECISDLRVRPKDVRLVLLMQFPDYCEIAKRDLFLRSLIIWDADKYLCRSDTTENMKLFCERIKAEFTHFDQSRSIITLNRHIRALSNSDLCTVALKNNYQRKLMMQNPDLKAKLLNALDQKIKESSLGNALWEYLAYCVKNNVWNI